MKMDNFSTYKLISDFNRSDFRRKSIPQELFVGWPCVQKVGKTFCMTIPYYSRKMVGNTVELYPIYCSVTVPVANPDRVMDFTIYPHQKDWADLDYKKPVGYFKHPALDDVKTKGEYQQLVQQLFGYYDKLVQAVMNKKPFAEEKEMIELFSKLMEPGQFPQYLRINQKFYGYFCRL